MNPYNLDEVHDEIANIYKFFAVAAPGVTPQEEGTLGSLWALADHLHEEERNVQ